MQEDKKKILIYSIYSLIVVFIFAFLLWLGHFKLFQDFIGKIENSSFDLRQHVISNYKKPNKDLMILAVDDATYEYIMDKYGYWPISRAVWADVVNSLENVKAKYIIFDMLFVKPNLNDIEADNAFVKSVQNNNNVFLSMNFDNYSDEIRKSPKIDPKFHLNVTQGSIQDNEYVTFINVRSAMKELSDVTKNIGVINVARDNDGIIRDITPIFKYKRDYYPNLSLSVALDLLEKDSVSIEKRKIVLDKKHTIPLDKTNRAVLNWYGKSGTYPHVSLWRVLQAIRTNDTKFLKDNFENKIVYIGTTATSLSDVKTTPIESNMAGVELHTNFLNNILDNSFIKKTNKKVDFFVSIALSLLVGYFVLKTASVLKTFIFLFGILAAYAFVSIYLMHFFKIWITLVLPYLTIISTFILVYCEKYLLKAKDYEQTYKLAVTDGLTGLYNHRYFQEHMIVCVNNYKRYQAPFSLILIDIDFFKKFNDTYGHQSGDCVLKQVANVLRKNSRTSDIACRYGGEEMAIVLTNTNKMEASIAANKVCEAVRHNKFVLMNGKKAKVTISVGVATIGIDGDKPQELIEYADKCLYKAKTSGRDQVVTEV